MSYPLITSYKHMALSKEELRILWLSFSFCSPWAII